MSDQTLFTIENIDSKEKLEQLVELHSLVFGETPINQLNLTTLISFIHSGQHLLGVFSEQQLFGYLIAYFGTYNRDPRRPAMANLKLALDRIAVHPDYRSIGLGSQLMTQLREIAVKQAVRVITAAFSPLNSRAAYLLIRRLGAMVNEYHADYFPSGLLGDAATFTRGQLIAEWWLNRNRVEERLFGQRNPLTLNQYLDVVPIINPTSIGSDDLAYPYEKEPALDGETMLLVEIPSDYDAIQQRDTALATEWCRHIQPVMQTVFGQGYVATDFLYDTREGRLRSFYLMSWDGPKLSFDIEEED